MHPNLWRIEDHQAYLQAARLTARVNVLQPGAGVSQLQIDHQTLQGARILQVDLPPVEPNNAAALIEFYPRCGDLVATYAQSGEHPFRTQVYWRALEIVPAPTIAAIELIVSTQTDLLDAPIGLCARSSLHATAAFRLADAQSERFDEVDLPLEEPLRLDRCSGTGCFVLRTPASDFSYVEMVHPVDFRTVIIRASGQADEVTGGYPLSLSYDLFTDNLEKGVILRARARGVYVPRAADLAAAVGHWREFVASRPPLET